MADDRIPQAQSDVLDGSGKRFTLPWFRFFAALDGILATISTGIATALLKANNLSDVTSAATAFANIKQAASGTTTGVVQQTQVDCWVHAVPKVVDGTVVVIQKAPFAGTITASVTDCDSGTCTFRPRIEGSNVGSSNNSVSTTESDVTHSSANTFSVGDTISYTISANSTCLGARFQINYSRNLAA
jgi:hypothetical protein